MNTTIAVALITGLSAVIPNILITYFNNKNQYNLKKFETDEIAKRQAIIDFSNAVAECVSYDGGIATSDLSNYQKATSKLFLYFPNTNQDTIDKINSAIYDKNLKTKFNIVNDLIKELSKELFDK